MSTERPHLAPRRVLVLISSWLLLLSAPTAGHTQHVLVLHSNDPLLPANLAMDDGLGAALPVSVQVGAEFLSAPRFSGTAYGASLTKLLREKYTAWRPDVVVTYGDEVLRFILQHRTELFPRVPVVSAAVQESVLESLPPLRVGVVAIPIVYDFSGTIELALRLHPRARHLVLVTGTSPLDRSWESQLRAVLPQYRDRATIEYLAGLPTEAVLKRLGELGDAAVVVTPGYFRDGAGRELASLQVLKPMVAAAAVPVYGPFDTFMDAGIVGGSIVSFATVGHEAGEAASALLAGTPSDGLHLPAVTPTTLHLDWRQVRRWGIDPARIPRAAVIDFKEPPFSEQHPGEAIGGVLVLLIQNGLIGWLLIERRRRRLAEQAVQKQHLELVHACRLATAGELTASIAHEINQPLGAILSNADAAELLLDGGTGGQTELRAILADIRRDDARASEVIRRLRVLLTKHEVERKTFDLRQVVLDATAMLESDARRRGLSFDVRLSPTATVIGDRIEISQVLINLILNAMDAMVDAPDGRRTLRLSVASVAGNVTISVRDQGNGIAPEHLPRVFDSFFTTKDKGMGLGLSIARTIVETHGGRIWAENAPDQGAVFHVSLPAAKTGAPGAA